MNQSNEWGPDDDASLDENADANLDAQFPLGDGVADDAGVITCPYCGETVELILDPGSGAHQQYIEDCSVCCRPWNVSVTYRDDGSADVSVEANDDL